MGSLQHFGHVWDVKTEKSFCNFNFSRKSVSFNE